MPFGFQTYDLLGLINLLVPKARASRRVASGLAYGVGPRHKLDFYAPRSSTGPWPLVMLFYGGAWDAGNRSYYEFAGRALAAAGFLVAVPDYRLVPEVEYPVFLEDCAEATAFAVSQAATYGGDATRIAVTGHSAGAYNAAMLVMDPRYLAARGLMESVKAFAGLSGPYDFYPFDVAISMRTFGAVPNPRATQPVNLVRPGLPRTWLGHGQRDTLVGKRNSVALALALRAQGVDVTECYYPELNHPGTLLALGGPGTRKVTVLADLTAFLTGALRETGSTR